MANKGLVVKAPMFKFRCFLAVVLSAAAAA